MGDEIVKSKKLCCQPVVFPSLSLLKRNCTVIWLFKEFKTNFERDSHSVKKLVKLQIDELFCRFSAESWATQENVKKKTVFKKFALKNSSNDNLVSVKLAIYSKFKAQISDRWPFICRCFVESWAIIRGNAKRTYKQKFPLDLLQNFVPSHLGAVI